MRPKFKNRYRNDKNDGRQQLFKQKRTCRFTARGITKVDYKDVDFLRTFINDHAKITPSRLTATKARYQRRLAVAVKRARFLALLPYTDSHFN